MDEQGLKKIYYYTWSGWKKSGEESWLLQQNIEIIMVEEYIFLDQVVFIQWNPNNENIGRIYQMSSWQFFNEFYTILRKFQYLWK